MPELRVELLGPIRAWSGAREVALGSSRPRAVFAMLATRHNSVVSRDELIDGVWGAGAPATAAGSLHTYISTLRKSLEPERARRAAATLLRSVGSGYRLRVDGVDVAEFNRLRERAKQLLDTDAGGALRLVDDALGLWHGEALSGIAGPFAEAERVRLGELRAATVELHAEAGLAAGRHDDMVAELATFVREHPLRERPRELLMLALHQSGRNAEALATYREARQVLVDELGIEPSLSLRRMHDQILAGETASAPVRVPAPRRETTRVAPGLVGREPELARVRALVDDVAAGAGRCLWLEGEMGIGKSALVATALAWAESAGCQIAHAAADELGQRFPLRLVLDALGVDTDSPDPRRATVATTLRDRAAQPMLAGGDPVVALIDELLTLVKTLCADGPLVLALDDLHWADEASMLVWHRLAEETGRRPLLLIGATRPVPHRTEVDRLRLDAAVRGGVSVDLVPLNEPDVARMVSDLVGAPPGPYLREVTARAGGNPLYVHEITHTLLRDQAVAVGAGTAEVGREWVDLAPASLVSAVTGRLGYLSDITRKVLRSAALLYCGGVAVEELSIVLGSPASDLVPSFDEAIAAGVLRTDGPRLVFRHPVLRQALYEGIAPAIRDALHNQAAKALAEAGAPVEHVARQLIAAGGEARRWVTGWLITATPVLIYRAPLVAVELLGRAVRDDDRDTALRVTCQALLAGVLFRIGRDDDAERNARQALQSLTEPNRTAELRWILAYVPYRASRAEEALMTLEEALADPVLPDVWRARLLSLLALVQRSGVGELDSAVETARAAIEVGERVHDGFAVGQALGILWQVDAVRRDYLAAVRHLDQALAVVGTDLSLTDLRLVLLDNRIFTLQCLDRLAEATADLDLAMAVAGTSHPVAGLHIAGAVHYFWLGRWDEALAEINAVLDDPEFTGYGLREGGGAQLLMHGVAALIAAHRDDDTALRRHLEAGTNLPLVTAADRENCDFLLAAQATAEWRKGNLAEGIATLGAILVTKNASMMLRHQWLPDLVRLALERGDLVTAEAAVVACELEAARESTPARAAAAARRCRALLDADPAGLWEVITHYQTTGREYELAQTVADLARVLGSAGKTSEAAAARARADALHREMGAAWDIRHKER
ncbi:BTAD domain-containing putative transcriptional regulator [Actinophytocola sp.]|uniref:BTAD domain-containing putative transcriptional regulator n=1 Tax=Actinophytocola sp. TaxID=1872138 RepID=UPI002D3774CD|nr:BTAD domain-containing putative transcriptional regulator [Actinophytocola sp.]HYQ67550.1 BTAD domain-containing putative transcriptional regulator [Actinophytocola sp.]